jgi:hypothetical protein
MVENVNSISNRSLTETHFLLISPFLLILLGSLSLGVPNWEAISRESQSESEDLSDGLYTGKLLEPKSLSVVEIKPNATLIYEVLAGGPNRLHKAY